MVNALGAKVRGQHHLLVLNDLLMADLADVGNVYRLHKLCPEQFATAGLVRAQFGLSRVSIDQGRKLH